VAVTGPATRSSDLGRGSSALGPAVLWYSGLIVLVLIAVLLRLATIGAQPLWLDEVYTYSLGSGSLTDTLRGYALDVHPPLYGVLLRCWQAVAGSSPIALRSFSSLWSVVGLVFAALLARDVTRSAVAGLISGLLMAVNPLDIWYAQEARNYALTASLATVATWVLWRWLTDARTTAPLAWPWAYGVLAALQLHSHYTAAVVVAAQILAAAVVFTIRRAWVQLWRLVVAGGGAAQSFLPWALYVYGLRGGLYNQNVAWIPRLPAIDVLGYLNHEYFSGFATLPASLAFWFSAAAGALLVGVGLAAALSQRGMAGPRRLRDLAWLLWLATGPCLLAAAVGLFWHPVYFRPRFSLFCLAPAVVVAVALLARVRAPLRTALLCALAALMAVGTWRQAATPCKQGMSELASLAAAFGDPQFAVFAPSPHLGLAQYYLPHTKLHNTLCELSGNLPASGSAIVWVAIGKAWVPSPRSSESECIARLARSGPHRLLGLADGFSVYELRSRLPLR
jgi:mannosyltransferase